MNALTTLAPATSRAVSLAEIGDDLDLRDYVVRG